MAKKILLSKVQKQTIINLASVLGYIKPSKFINQLLTDNTFILNKIDDEKELNVLRNIKSNLSQLEDIANNYSFTNNLVDNDNYKNYFNEKGEFKNSYFVSQFNSKSADLKLYNNPKLFELISHFYVSQLKQAQEIIKADTFDTTDKLETIATPDFYSEALDRMSGIQELDDQLMITLEDDSIFDEQNKNDELIHFTKHIESQINAFKEKVISYDDNKYFKMRTAKQIFSSIDQLTEAFERIQIRETKLIVDKMKTSVFKSVIYKYSDSVIELHTFILEQQLTLNELIKKFHANEKINDGLISHSKDESDLECKLMNNFIIISMRIHKTLQNFKKGNK